MATATIIDLSHHNPTPDWAAVKASGIIGVILKATEGTGYVDPTYISRRANAANAGLAVCSYHFLKHGNVTTQMNHYLNTVQPVSGERVILDYEDSALTLDDLRAAVTQLQQADNDLQITVYGGSLLEEHLGNSHDDLLAQTSLWTAQYTSASSPTWPTGTWPVWSLWQFSDSVMVSGISQRVDGNKFNGSNANALKWLNPAEVQPAPPPAPPEPVDEFIVAITVPPGQSVEVFINGEHVN